HGLRGDGLAGVEPRGPHETEGPGPRVGRALPALGEPRDDLWRVPDVLHQRIVERLLHHADRPVVLHARVERRHLLPSREDEDLPVPRALEAGDGRGDDERRQRHGHDHAHAHPHGRHGAPPPAATSACAAVAAGYHTHAMASLRPVAAAEIESLAIGAWILGTGGGGSPYLALLNMRKLYRQGAVCRLMDPMALGDDDLVAVVSNMGAPLVGQERLADPRTVARAVTMMEEYLGRRFHAVMSLEIGGGNAIQPFMAAALLDLPVVDADCMGRAFPEAQMTSFAIHNLRMYPLTLADVRDNAVIVARAASWKWMERLSRKACVEVGSIA